MATVSSPPETRLITGAEFALMPGLDGCELVKGRITPLPPPPFFEHGVIEANLCAELVVFVRAGQLGRVAVGEAGLYTRRAPDTIRGADVIYISKERLAQRASTTGYLDVGPELIAEVLSLSNTMSAMMQKMREYFDIGVQLVWLVDQDVRCVYAYRSLTDVREFTADQTLTGDAVLPGFALPVARLFE